MLSKQNKFVIFLIVIIGSLTSVLYLDATGKPNEAENIALLVFAGLVIAMAGLLIFRKPVAVMPPAKAPQPVVKTYQFY